MADKRKTSRKPQGGTVNEPGGVEESKNGVVTLGEEVQKAIRTAVMAAVQEATREQRETNTRLERAMLEQQEAMREQHEMNTRLERALLEQREQQREQREQQREQSEMMAKLIDMVSASKGSTQRSSSAGDVEDQPSKVESDEDEEEARTPTGPGGALNFTPAPTAGPNRRRTTFQLSEGARAFARPSTSTSVREAEARGIVEKAKKSFTTTFSGDEKTDVMALVEWLIEAEAVTQRQWQLDDQQAVQVAASRLRGRARKVWAANAGGTQKEFSWHEFKETMLSLVGGTGTETETLADVTSMQRDDESWDDLVFRHAVGNQMRELRFNLQEPDSVRISRLLATIRDRSLATTLEERGFERLYDLLAYVRRVWRGATAIPAKFGPMSANAMAPAPTPAAAPARAPTAERKALLAATRVEWARPVAQVMQSSTTLEKRVEALSRELSELKAAKQQGSRVAGESRGDERHPRALRKCYGCGQPGHIRRDCPKPLAFTGECFACGKKGHRRAECRSVRRNSGGSQRQTVSISALQADQGAAVNHQADVAELQAEVRELKAVVEAMHSQSGAADGGAAQDF